MAFADKEKEKAYRRAYYEKTKEGAYERTKHNTMKWRETHKEQFKKITKDYYLDNKQAILEKSKEYRVKNSNLLKEKERLKSQNLTDGYLRKQLIKKGYSRVTIRNHPELIESLRLITLIKRETR